MDSLQGQIVELGIRIDALHQMIERLSEKVSNVLLEVKSSTGNASNRFQSGVSYGHYSNLRSDFEAAMEHKDVLTDDGYLDSEHQSGEHILSADVQIQRLTAQLTAAYNRIAALEEQLLSHRIH